MKKIITTLFSTILILLSIIQLYSYNMQYYDQLFTNRSTFSMLVENGKTEKEMIDTLENIAHKYKVVLSRDVFVSDTNVHIFTTDINAYSITRRKGSNRVLLPMKGRTVIVDSLDHMSQLTGLDGIYSVTTNDRQKVNSIISDLKKNGVIKSKLEFMKGSSSFSFYSYVTSFIMGGYIPILLLLIISCFISIFIIVKIAMQESKKIVILHLQGLTKYDVLKNVMYSYSLPVLSSLALTSVFIIGMVMLVGNSNFLFNFYRYTIINFLILLLISVIILFSIVKAIYVLNTKLAIIKGYAPNRSVLILQFILKYIMLISVCILLLFVMDTQKMISISLQNNKNWMQTRNIYRIGSKWTISDDKEERRIDYASERLYNELAAKNKIFFIDANNYDKFYGTNKLLWEKNVESNPNILYSEQGKSIVVDENYLKRHPVLTTNGQDVRKQIVKDDLVRNIVVPISLKSKETKIREGFLESFNFEKLGVADIYRRNLGETPPAIDKSQLKVNIIYVKNGNRYFTYNKEIVPEQNNTILDPIVVIETGNVDPYHYQMHFTRNMYFESHQPDAISEIADTIKKHGLFASYNTAVSIYNERSNEIQKLTQNRNVILFVGAITIVLYAFFMYILNQSYFEQYKYVITIKRIFGYSFMSIFKIKILVELLLNVFITYLFSNIMISIAVIGIDILLTYSFTIYIMKRSLLSVLKKGI